MGFLHKWLLASFRCLLYQTCPVLLGTASHRTLEGRRGGGASRAGTQLLFLGSRAVRVCVGPRGGVMRTNVPLNVDRSPPSALP